MAAERPRYILDSLALLAYLEGEPGMPRVREVLQGAQAGEHVVHLSLINLGEVLYITERERGLVQAQRTMAAIDQLPLRLEEVSRAAVLEAAHVKARYPVSYADAFAVATARDLRGVLVTGDPEMQAVVRDGLVVVDWLPRR